MNDTCKAVFDLIGQNRGVLYDPAAMDAYRVVLTTENFTFNKAA